MRRLTTIPGVGEVSALAVHAFAPSIDSFVRGRDFAAWIGLTPRKLSTGDRQQLGRITKMGQRDLRQLLVLGATAVIRHARRRKEITDPWLRRMVADKPAKLVAAALANQMARIIWALVVKGQSYDAPTVLGAAAGWRRSGQEIWDTGHRGTSQRWSQPGAGRTANDVGANVQ